MWDSVIYRWFTLCSVMVFKFSNMKVERAVSPPTWSPASLGGPWPCHSQNRFRLFLPLPLKCVFPHQNLGLGYEAIGVLGGCQRFRNGPGTSEKALEGLSLGALAAVGFLPVVSVRGIRSSQVTPSVELRDWPCELSVGVSTEISKDFHPF